MEKLSLLDLPVELLQYIFYYLDAWTIFRSLRYVCKQLYAITNTHNTYRLNSKCTEKSDYRLISRIIKPEMITSLILFEDYRNSVLIQHFLLDFNLHQFTRLRSLWLDQIYDDELKQFLQHIPNCSLMSLGIATRIQSCVRSKMLSSILSAIAESNLQNLYLNHLDFTLNPTSWSIQCPLRCLTLDGCENVDYRVILDRLPHLRTFFMDHCTMTHVSNQPVLLSDRHTSNKSSVYSQLTSLTIYMCKPVNIDPEYIVSLTPSLIHFKFISTKEMLDSNADGHYWERLIQAKLRLLEKFEIFFTYKMSDIQQLIPSLDSLIISFQTPFWIEDKRWFVTIDYLMSINWIRVYTTPPCINRFYKDRLRCELSSMNTNYRFVGSIRTGEKYIDVAEIKTLNELNMHHRYVRATDVQYLAYLLRNNTTITKLDLGYNEIEDKGAQYIADLLRTNQTLTDLDLTLCHIKDTGAKYLADALRENTTLTVLCLRANEIGDEGAKHLIDAARNNKTLITLILECENPGNSAHNRAVEAVFRIRNDKTFTKLLLPCRRDGYEIGEIGAGYLADALRYKAVKTLTEINLGGHHIGDQGVQLLTDSLRNNKTLIKLDLHKNKIGSKGIEYLADMLRINMTLVKLNLWDNQIGDKGVEYLANTLRDNSSLTELVLVENRIGPVGVRHLVDVLNNNTTLTRLDLEHNQILDEGVEYLAELLLHNKVLSQLNLNGNPITDKGRDYLANALRNNTLLNGPREHVKCIAYQGAGNRCTVLCKE